MEATGRKRSVAAFRISWCACSQAEPGAPVQRKQMGGGAGEGESLLALVFDELRVREHLGSAN